VGNLENTSAASTTDVSKVTSDGGRRAIKWLMAITLGLVALQPVSAGFLLSGYDYASTIHTAVAVALQLVAVIQAVAAVVMWLRHRVSVRVAGLCVGLFVVVLLEVWAGRNREYWLHVPVGVGILVSLRGGIDKLDALWRT
jgi:predicted DNA repair protein MutK